MWIVTRNINEYDQDGEYFVSAYVEKPSFNQLKELIEGDDKTIGKLTRGGGRQKYEYEWYHLHEVKDGERFNLSRIIGVTK